MENQIKSLMQNEDSFRQEVLELFKSTAVANANAIVISNGPVSEIARTIDEPSNTPLIPQHPPQASSPTFFDKPEYKPMDNHSILGVLGF